MFLAYQGWAGVVDGEAYSTDRIWGKVDPTPGVAETMNDERRTSNAQATIVRGILDLQPAIHNLQSEFVLLSVDGRKVMDLAPGANDVRALAPGVYFVREAQAQAQAQAVRKIVVTK
jgi:hypothetical protein